MRNIIARFVSFVAFIRSYTDPVIDKIFSPGHRYFSKYNDRQKDLIWMTICLALVSADTDRAFRRYNEKDYFGLAFAVLMVLYWGYQAQKVFDSFGDKPSDKVVFDEDSNVTEIDDYMKKKNLK